MSRPVPTVDQRLEQIQNGLLALGLAEGEIHKARLALQDERSALIEQLEEVSS